MSKRKDREKFERIKRLYPEYQGYKGPRINSPSPPELKSLVCTRCGRRRNVSLDVPEEGFVCVRCLSEVEG